MTTSEQRNSGTTIFTSTCQNYAGSQVTITAPTAGRIAVDGHMWVKLNHVTGTADAVTVGVDETPTVCGTFYDFAEWDQPGALPSGEYDTGLNTHRVFDVAAGVHTYYLNGVMSSGANTQDRMWYGSMHATFFPG